MVTGSDRKVTGLTSSISIVTRVALQSDLSRCLCLTDADVRQCGRKYLLEVSFSPVLDWPRFASRGSNGGGGIVPGVAYATKAQVALQTHLDAIAPGSFSDAAGARQR